MQRFKHSQMAGRKGDGFGENAHAAAAMENKNYKT
jgi:hypothetical protein